MSFRNVKFDTQFATNMLPTLYGDNTFANNSFSAIDIYNPDKFQIQGLDFSFMENFDTFSLSGLPSVNPYGNFSLQMPNYNLNIGSIITQSMEALFRENATKMNGFMASLMNGFNSAPVQTATGNQAASAYTPAVAVNNKSNNNDYITELDPVMQNKVKQLEEFAKKEGIPFKITSGYRTREEQIALQKKYAGQKGRVAGADTSKHRFGKAIDISVNSLSQTQRKKLGDYAKSIGMRWGGDFKTYREDWHFDIA